MPLKRFPSAETRFREAFERLKNGCPELLPLDASVSQNNVAQEAGCKPSALRKERFPSLVADIQSYVSNAQIGENAVKRKYERALLRIDEMAAERDAAERRYEKATSDVLHLLVEVAELKRVIKSYQKASTTPFRSSESLVNKPRLREVRTFLRKGCGFRLTASLSPVNAWTRKSIVLKQVW